MYHPIGKASLPAPITAAVFGTTSLCYATTVLGEVFALDASSGEGRAHIATQMERVAVTWLHDSETLAVAGIARLDDYDQEQLVVQILSSALEPLHRFVLGVGEGAATGITDLGGARALVGCEGLALLNLGSGAVEWQRPVSGFLSSRGLLYAPQTDTAYAVWCSQGQSWVCRYTGITAAPPADGSQTSLSASEHVTGAALAADGATIAVVAIHDPGFIRDASNGVEAQEYGRLIIIRADAERRLIPLHDPGVRHTLGGEAGRDRVLAALNARPSNPVFLTEDVVAVGEPSGRIIVWPLDNGPPITAFEGLRAPVATLALAPSGLLAVGDHIGGVHFLRPLGA